jgi:peptidyl-prolyl cis-trans isomerase SurA
MYKNLVRLFVIVLLICGLSNSVSARSSHKESIAVVVNDGAITWSDVQARMKLIIVSSGMPYTDEIIDKMKPQIMNLLIEEQLKLQEALKLGVEVSEDDIEEGFETIAKQNNFTKQQFRAILTKEGIPPRTIEDQIRSQIAWTKLIQRRLASQVTITDNDVLAMRERLKINLGKKEYLVSEIFLPIESPKEEQNVKQIADRVVRQILDNKVPFQKLASQFSQSASSARGGDMGWVQDGQLHEELNSQLTKMNKGDLSKPVRTLSGFHILLLRGEREITEDNLPTDEQIRNQLGNQQLDRLQKRYLQDLKTESFDLKTESFIEHRV